METVAAADPGIGAARTLTTSVECPIVGDSGPSVFVQADVIAKVDTMPVRLALRVLLPHCPERWPLVNLWESAGQDNDIGRAQGVNAAFNGILRQLARSGALGGYRCNADRGMKYARAVDFIVNTDITIGD